MLDKTIRCPLKESGGQPVLRAEALNGNFVVGIAMVAGNAEHFVDDVGVDGCRLIGKGRGLEELSEVGLEWGRD